MENIANGRKEVHPVVDEIIYMHGTEKEEMRVLVPDNKAELIIPLQENLQLKPLGGIRPMIISCCGIFFMPRRRGIEIILPVRGECLIVKINAIYARKFARALKEESCGAFSLSLKNAAVIKVLDAFVQADHELAAHTITEALTLQEDLYECNEVLLDSIRQISEASGDIKVKEIYSTMNVSKSKLELHFNREIGLSPKEFCKIEKINRFIRSYFLREHESLTELTYQCGYYDQSHLIKDFQYFLDTSPRKYFSTIE